MMDDRYPATLCMQSRQNTMSIIPTNIPQPNDLDIVEGRQDDDDSQALHAKLTSACPMIRMERTLFLPRISCSKSRGGNDERSHIHCRHDGGKKTASDHGVAEGRTKGPNKTASFRALLSYCMFNVQCVGYV
jgi:hypothetical protein